MHQHHVIINLFIKLYFSRQWKQPKRPIISILVQRENEFFLIKFSSVPKRVNNNNRWMFDSRTNNEVNNARSACHFIVAVIIAHCSFVRLLRHTNAIVCHRGRLSAFRCIRLYYYLFVCIMSRAIKWMNAPFIYQTRSSAVADRRNNWLESMY